MKTRLPHFLSRISFLLALAGAFIGVVIGFSNGDELGWSLLRGAFLFVAFGLMSRWFMGSIAKAWLESRLESLQTPTTNTLKKTDTRPALSR
ncbi:MAG: hypothetical protein WDO13_05875 [Verrucomicrobiota bacterium]